MPEIENILHIMPAFTWYQPHWSPIDPNDQELSEPFSGYLYIGTSYRNIYSLAKQRQSLIIHGANVKKLHLNYNGRITRNDQYQKDDYNVRATIELLSEISEKLEFLTICRDSSAIMPTELIDAMRPAFNKINTLEWKTFTDCNILQQLNELCPKLERLKIISPPNCNVRCGSRTTTLEPTRSSLKHLSCHQRRSDCTNLLRALEWHPELLSLNVSLTDSNALLAITTFNLKLETLEIWDNALDDVDINLPLDHLKNLADLRLFVYRNRETYDLNNISAQMAKIAKADQIQASVLIRNHRARRENHTDSITFIHHGVYVSVIANNVLEITIGTDKVFTHRIPMCSSRRYVINVISASHSYASNNSNVEDDIVSELYRNGTLFDDEFHYHRLCLDASTCIYFHVASFDPKFTTITECDDR